MHAPLSPSHRVEWRELSSLAPIAAEWRELAARALEPNVFSMSRRSRSQPRPFSAAAWTLCWCVPHMAGSPAYSRRASNAGVV
jgi:hypothetical protein